MNKKFVIWLNAIDMVSDIERTMYNLNIFCNWKYHGVGRVVMLLVEKYWWLWLTAVELHANIEIWHRTARLQQINRIFNSSLVTVKYTLDKPSFLQILVFSGRLSPTLKLCLSKNNYFMLFLTLANFGNDVNIS